jgi:hypothetical protein
MSWTPLLRPYVVHEVEHISLRALLVLRLGDRANTEALKSHQAACGADIGNTLRVADFYSVMDARAELDRTTTGCRITCLRCSAAADAAREGKEMDVRPEELRETQEPGARRLP